MGLDPKPPGIKRKISYLHVILDVSLDYVVYLEK